MAAQSLPSMPPMAMEPPSPPLQVKLLSSTATAPSRSSAFAAGYDLYASKESVVPSWNKALVDTDISIAVPAGTYGRVAPRSGLASKHSIDTGAGVIDADYRGPVKVLLFNLSKTDFHIAVGDRVAQLIVERVSSDDILLDSSFIPTDNPRSLRQTSSSSTNSKRPFEAPAASAPQAALAALCQASMVSPEHEMLFLDLCHG